MERNSSWLVKLLIWYARQLVFPLARTIDDGTCVRRALVWFNTVFTSNVYSICVVYEYVVVLNLLWFPCFVVFFVFFSLLVHTSLKWEISQQVNINIYGKVTSEGKGFSNWSLFFSYIFMLVLINSFEIVSRRVEI